MDNIANLIPIPKTDLSCFNPLKDIRNGRLTSIHFLKQARIRIKLSLSTYICSAIEHVYLVSVRGDHKYKDCYLEISSQLRKKIEESIYPYKTYNAWLAARLNLRDTWDVSFVHRQQGRLKWIDDMILQIHNSIN